VKDKKDGHGDASEARGVAPFQGFSQIGDGEDRKNRESDDLLNCLQLCGGKFVGSDAVCRHLEAILKERDSPTHHHHFPKRHVAILQVPVPSKSHENVRNCQQYDSSQSSFLATFDFGRALSSDRCTMEFGPAKFHEHRRCRLPLGSKQPNFQLETSDVAGTIGSLFSPGTCVESAPGT